MSKKVFIYALHDPDTDAVRYVGASVNPIKRLMTHGAGGSMEKIEWVRGLKRQGKKPTVEILAECAYGERWNYEAAWIAYYLGEGANLLNERNC